MTTKPTPPFRAEHIGSLLRPAELLEKRKAFDTGQISAEALREVEDRYIKDAVALQEEVGLQSITDGEYRRIIYFGHFPAAVEGFTEMEAELDFKDEAGQKMKYLTPVVTGKLRRARGIATDEYLYVKSLTHLTPKVTLPSPCSQHYFRWREGISEQAYPDIDEFFYDVARVYQEELAELASLGVTYVQLDDVSLPLLCDDRLRAGFIERGYDPDTMVGKYIDVINESIKSKPDIMTIGMHFCRGNNQGKWLGAGGYDYVAERIFNGLDIDAFFMEYDSPRAGSFEPLRFMPDDKHVILGLVSTKIPELESEAELGQRIDEASQHVPLDRLSLSPQCGFASTAPGNPVTVDDQRAKLALVVRVADQVWGV